MSYHSLFSRSLVAVSTCPRRKYLADTIARLDEAGAADHPLKFVLWDGPPSERLDPSWRVVVRDQALGLTRANMWTAIRLADFLRVDRLLYFEDDIACTRNAVTRLEHITIPDDLAFVTAYDPKPYAGRFRAGLHYEPTPLDVQGRHFWGSLALVIPKGTLRFLAEQNPFECFTDRLGRAGDAALAMIASRYRPFVGYHVPSLVRHVGVLSLAWPGVYRRPETFTPYNYPGDDFDALTAPYDVHFQRVPIPKTARERARQWFGNLER